MKPKRLTSRVLQVTGLAFTAIAAVLWWHVWSYHQDRSASIIKTWVALEQQLADGATRSLRAWMATIPGDRPVQPEDIEIEAFHSFIESFGLLDEGVVWVTVDGLVYYGSEDSSIGSFTGRTIAEVFAAQAKAGAQHYDELVNGVEKGASGTTWYVWDTARGREYAAWSTVELRGQNWTIGISTPEAAILELVGENEELTRNLVGAGMLTFLLLVVFVLLWRSQRHDVLLMQELERSVAERTRDLVRSENRYRTLVENLREGILIYDPSAEQVIYTNPAVADIFGKLRKDGITQPLDITRLLETVDGERLVTMLKQQVADETPLTGIFQARTVNGAPLWLEIRTTRVEFEGRPVNVLLVNNFTERKRSEAALRESEERYRGIFNGVQDAILVQDTAGRIVDVNTSACELFSYSREEFLYRSLTDLCTSESLAIMERPLDESSDRHCPRPFEATAIHASGRRFPVEISIRAQCLNGAEVTLVVLRDITQRKLAVEAVTKAHERVDQLMASVPDALWSGEVIPPGTLKPTYVSPVFEKITGYPVRQFIEKPQQFIEIIHPEDRPLVEREIKRLYSGQISSVELEYRIVRSDGAIRCVRDRESVRLVPPERLRVDAVLMDVTEQKRVERALKKANRDLSLTVKELQTRHREVLLLNEMGDMLQSCVATEDAYAVIARFTAQLFPTYSGALFLFNGQGQAEPAVTWGEQPPARAAIQPQDCWGLRRNRLHVFTDADAHLRCQHVVLPNPPAYLCAPLLAQGETLGLLHLVGSRQQPVEQRTSQLAETLARQVALAVSNMRLRERLRRQAIQDSLTNLYNRRYMEETLAKMVAGPERVECLGIILLDIDHFKACNDSLGHEAGDTLLVAFGNYLKNAFSKAGIACRYGGDEFVVILPNQSLSSTLREAEKLRSGFRQLRVYHEGELLKFNTLSLGVAAFPNHGETLPELMRRADAALYEAKSAGGDQVVVARLK